MDLLPRHRVRVVMASQTSLPTRKSAGFHTRKAAVAGLEAFPHAAGAGSGYGGRAGRARRGREQEAGGAAIGNMGSRHQASRVFVHGERVRVHAAGELLACGRGHRVG